MLRTLFSLVIIGGLAYCGATVPLGERTFFGHVANIWASDEAQEMVDGVKDKSQPLVDRVKRGVRAGLNEDSQAPDSQGDASNSESTVAARDADESNRVR